MPTIPDDSGASRVPIVKRASSKNKISSEGMNSPSPVFAFLNAVRPNTVPKIVAYFTATGLAAGGVIYYHYLTTNSFLQRLDADYQLKCYSPDEGRGLTGPGAQKEFERITNLMQSFGQRGVATANDFKNGNYILCSGINDISVSPKMNWPYYKVYFSSSDYFDEQMALFMTKTDKEKFWEKAVTLAYKIKEYVPESGLMFARAHAATMAVEDIRNYARAIEDNFDYADSIERPKWHAFVQENPSWENTIKTFIDVYNEDKSEENAMTAAFQTFMQDPVATKDTDVTYLTGYNYHVRIVDNSSHTDIYKKTFSLSSSDYALIDADRDGEKDDLVRLSVWGNDAVEYFYNYGTSTRGLSHKQESYDCGYTDDKGNKVYITCYQDVRETVHYQMIPHEDAASVHLDPKTLMQMAALSETDFINHDFAKEILVNPLNAMPLEPVGKSLMENIQENIAKNIPESRDTGLSEPGLGLH